MKHWALNCGEDFMQYILGATAGNSIGSIYEFDDLEIAPEEFVSLAKIVSLKYRKQY
jgi:hypothetical protein